MSFTSWLSDHLVLSSRTPGRAPRPASKRKATALRRTFRPSLENLEDRWVPSTLMVTRSIDDVSQHGTLRWAVANAQDGDTILLTNVVKNTGITLTQGELVLGQDVTIEAKGKTPVTISGGDLSRIFKVAPGAQVTLSNLVITGGNGSANNPAGDPDWEGSGGGILVDAGAVLTISKSSVSGNSASSGGGIFSYGTLTVSGSTLSGNYAAFGGGIDNLGTATVSGSTLSGNYSEHGGGGILNWATLTVSGSTLSGNSTGNSTGGGIASFGSTTLTVSGSTFFDNFASVGGAIYNEAGTLTVSGCTLSGNSAGSYGGGIANLYGTVAVIDSTLSGNRAGEYGGGIWNQGGLTISGSSVSGNSAYDGGGIYNFAGGTVTVRDNSHIIGNSAYSGADVYNRGVLYLEIGTSEIGILDGIFLPI